MGRIAKYTRRGFLGLGALAAGGVAVGYYFYQRPYANPLAAQAAEGEAVFNPYVKIAPDGAITVIAPRAEMGQSIQTTLAALVAEELDVDLDQIEVIHGPASEAYYNAAMFRMGGPFPWFDDSIGAAATRTTMGVVAKFLGMQVTGGSSATIDAFEKMREAGAAAREVLKAAAAAQWGGDADALTTERGVITNPATGATLAYGDVATEAAGVSPPRVRLRDPSEWRLLGRSQPRVEGIAKVTGDRIFGIDIELPDMLHATVKMSPRFGAGAKSFDAAPALAVPGVRDVVEIETTTGKGFGIIADHTWAAFQGAEALEVTWEDAPYPATLEEMDPLFAAALDGDEAFELGGNGNVDDAFAAAAPDQVLKAEYHVPFLAHATMEPMNATAQMTGGRLEIWTGTQAPGIVRLTTAALLGIEAEDVIVHTTHLGGGFGRRGEADFPLYAAAIAQHTGGRPVKVTWSREEDTRHDVYRPRAAARMRAVVTPQGPEALDFRVAGPAIVPSVLGRTFPNFPAPAEDEPLLDGLFNQPVSVAAAHYAGSVVDLPIPVGFWRAVGNSQNGYFHECFLDEVAEKAGLDPVEMRLNLMRDPDHAPARGVLERVAQLADWGAEMPAGKGKGVAHMLSFGTWTAQVVQVDVSTGAVRIEKVWCVADPGVLLDPDNFDAQLMSGINFGLSQALGQKITFDQGEVVEGNFYDFDAMRMWQSPEIETEVLQTAPKMGGAGEVGTPPAIPALANAIHAATGQRIRRMPLSEEIDFV
ncbi:MAG: molybdopterin cofactor-binding domain-containing protein [Pseudomonadota bacterium]